MRLCIIVYCEPEIAIVRKYFTAYIKLQYSFTTWVVIRRDYLLCWNRPWMTFNFEHFGRFCQRVYQTPLGYFSNPNFEGSQHRQVKFYKNTEDKNHNNTIDILSLTVIYRCFSTLMLIQKLYKQWKTCMFPFSDCIRNLVSFKSLVWSSL